MAIKRKKIKIKDLFNHLNYNEEEQTWVAPKSLKILSEPGFEKVDALYKTNKRDVITIKTNNNILSGVPEHRIMLDNWTYLKDVKIGDKVETLSGTEEIIDIINENKQQNCYDLQVNNTHSFYTNNILSHNTEIMTAWLKLTKLNSLILFKNIKLAHELHSRMTKAGIDCGLVQGNNIDENHQVVMATVQSTHKLKRNNYEVIIVDEVHNASQDRYQRILRWDIFKYRFGFSATPFNKKNRLKSGGVKAWIGDIIVDVPALELIDKGYLARPKITFINIGKTIQNVKRQKTEKTVDEDGSVVKDKKVWYERVEKEIGPDVQWSSAERMGIVHNVYRNKIIETLANSLDGTVLVLVKYVDTHGERLYKNIDNSLFLSGKDKLKERIEAVDLLEKNEIKTIIASTIFDEGIDLKRVNNVILAGGGQSYERTLQRIGRGMRLFTDEDGKEKTSVKIFDFYDETHPILERHSKERMRYMEAEGYEVRVKKIDINLD